MSTFVFAVLWNAAVASGLAVIVAWVSRATLLRCRPALVHTLWLLVLAKLAIPPLIHVPVFGPVSYEKAAVQRQATPSDLVAKEQLSSAREGQPLQPSTTTAQQLEDDLIAAERRKANVPMIVFNILWACGALLLAIAQFARYVRVSRILRETMHTDERLAILAKAAAIRMGVRETPIICTVDAAITPLLWVPRNRPIIVLPLRLVTPMSEEQLACILCHELAHWVRRDHWSNMIALVVNVIFWWHPVAWWARREMRAAQELCCDGLALETGGLSRRCYAETLLQALDFVQSNQPLKPALASGFGSSSSLQRRFEMIATHNVRRGFSLAAVAIVVVGIAGMFCMPVRAQLKSELGEWSETSTLRLDHPVNIVTCNLDWLAVGDDGGNLLVWVTVKPSAGARGFWGRGEEAVSLARSRG